MVFQYLSQLQDAKEISDINKRESLRLGRNFRTGSGNLIDRYGINN